MREEGRGTVHSNTEYKSESKLNFVCFVYFVVNTIRADDLVV